MEVLSHCDEPVTEPERWWAILSGGTPPDRWR